MVGLSLKYLLSFKDINFSNTKTRLSSFAILLGKKVH